MHCTKTHAQCTNGKRFALMSIMNGTSHLPVTQSFVKSRLQFLDQLRILRLKQCLFKQNFNEAETYSGMKHEIQILFLINTHTRYAYICRLCFPCLNLTKWAFARIHNDDRCCITIYSAFSLAPFEFQNMLNIFSLVEFDWIRCTGNLCSSHFVYVSLQSVEEENGN